jgi:hypothetical protein
MNVVRDATQSLKPCSSAADPEHPRKGAIRCKSACILPPQSLHYQQLW